MAVHLVGIEAGSVRFRTWAPVVPKAPAPCSGAIRDGLCGYPLGEGPAFQAALCSVRSRVSAPCSQGVTEALVLAKDRARVRLPMAAPPMTRTQGANADCKPAEAVSNTARVSKYALTADSARPSKPRRWGSTPHERVHALFDYWLGRDPFKVEESDRYRYGVPIVSAGGSGGRSTKPACEGSTPSRDAIAWQQRALRGAWLD